MASKNTLLRVLFILFCFFVSDAVAQSCYCNHGAVTQEKPECLCQCFAEYLLPHCLYKAEDIVPMEIWLSGDVNQTYPLSGADIVTGLCWGFGRKPSDGNFSFLFATVKNRAVNGRTATTSSASLFTTPSVATTGVMIATVTMPGWAAQALLADFLNNNVNGYVMQSTLGGGPYSIIAVFDKADGPPKPLRYENELMSFFMNYDDTWCIPLSNMGWLFGALIVFLVIMYIERKYTFNTMYNMGAFVHRPCAKDMENPPQGARASHGSYRSRNSVVSSNHGNNAQRTKAKQARKESILLSRIKRSGPTVAYSEKEAEIGMKKLERRRTQLFAGVYHPSPNAQEPKERNPLSSSRLKRQRE